MAWNGSNGNSAVQQKKERLPRRPSFVRGMLVGLAAVSFVALCIWIYNVRTPVRETIKSNRKPASIGEIKPTVRHDDVDDVRAEKVRKVKSEINEVVREYIKKSPTNRVAYAASKHDPNDPDNILRTQVAKEVDILLRIRPGDRIPKQLFFSFMSDDVALSHARAKGDTLITLDGGNEAFLDSIKKWKVTIKDDDDDDCVARKQRLVDAQLELIKGIDEGLTVNDSIRAAYQYRVRAFEAREEMIKMLSELHRQEGSNNEDTIAMIKKANENLAAEGIKEIYPEDVIDDYEEVEK